MSKHNEDFIVATWEHIPDEAVDGMFQYDIKPENYMEEIARPHEVAREMLADYEMFRDQDALDSLIEKDLIEREK